jgi:hypothetical protein
VFFGPSKSIDNVGCDHVLRIDASWLLNRSSLLLLSHLHQLLNNDDPPTHEARWSMVSAPSYVCQALTKSAQARGLQVSAGGVTRGALGGRPR